MKKTLDLLGIDLGASSGRGIVGSYDGEKLSLREVHRFPNEPQMVAGRFTWDILSKYGKGILKLKPAFQSDQINYEAVYDRERDHLNLWLEAADSKSSIKVYALGGIKGSTVSREDESLAAEMVDGHL